MKAERRSMNKPYNHSNGRDIDRVRGAVNGYLSPLVRPSIHDDPTSCTSLSI